MQMNDMVIFSVDDHISEPPDMYQRHLTGKYLESAPKMIKSATGKDMWVYQGKTYPSVGLNAVVGRPFEEYGMEPTSMDQLRPGCFDVHERIKDMDVNGIAVSLNFGGKFGFCGAGMHGLPDPDLAAVHMSAWNDWHIDDWAGAYPGRFVSCCILPFWDMDKTVAEMKRISAKGCNVVTISDNPTIQGLPSIHNDYWLPFFKTLNDLDMTLCLHIGSGMAAPHASMESPIEAWISTMPMAIAWSAADWLQLKALHDYPNMRIALSEGSIGWVPYFKERADFANWRHQAWTHSRFKDIKPSELFERHFMNCFLDDKFGLQNVEYIGEDRITYECDYPHSDTLWPEVPEYLWESIKHLTDAQIDKATHLNAINWFRFDPFQFHKKEELTVGALRARAKAAGVDTTPKSSGGEAPLDAGEMRPITSGDIGRMMGRHIAEPAE